MKVLVICPLKVELRALKQALESKGHSFVHELTKLGPVESSSQMRLAVGGRGKQKFNEKLSRLLGLYPETTEIFCIGTAGALRTEVAIGDLILVGADPSLDLSTFTAVKIYRDQLTYSDTPIMDRDLAQNLSKSTNALAVCMEPTPSEEILGGRPYIEIRAVTDFADAEAINDFNTSLEIALNKASELLIHLLDEQKV